MANAQNIQQQGGKGASRVPDPSAGINDAMKKVNQAQLKLSHARGKAFMASRPVSIMDHQTGQWKVVPHSQAEQHVMGKGAGKKNSRKRISGKGQ